MRDSAGANERSLRARWALQWVRQPVMYPIIFTRWFACFALCFVAGIWLDLSGASHMVWYYVSGLGWIGFGMALRWESIANWFRHRLW
jgi:hypothetical protein